MLIWIDIEAPPHVQYLVPFKAAFERRGHQVIVTARDNSITLDLLAQQGITPTVIDGHGGGAGKVRKVRRIVERAFALVRQFHGSARPDLVIATSRAAALSSIWLRIPSFTFCDYEFVNLSSIRLSKSYVFYPEAIHEDALLAHGLKHDRLMPFPALKESLSFSGIDLDAIAPYPLPAAESAITVLVRPPGEEAHYFVPESKTLALELLEWLSKRDDAQVVYVARYTYQEAYLEQFHWTHQPIVLRGGVPFVPLLKAVDLVISSGGTMLREAAYLGIPAYSIFRSSLGQVDSYLASIGRLTIIESADAFDRIRITKAPPLAALDDDPAAIVEDLTRTIVAVTERSRQHRVARPWIANVIHRMRRCP
jgi:uncharacterized protein